MNSPAPIALFAYNRPDHLRRTVESLRANDLAGESDLFIFSDGPRDDAAAQGVKAVREYIRGIDGFKSVHIVERPENFGLARSIISGVTDLVGRAGRVIVLEDDMVTSPAFLRYMNDGLALYEHEDQVASIHGYMYPVRVALPQTFFLRGADCWGWATWKRAWNAFEPDGSKLLSELERRGLVRAFDFEGTYDFSGMLRRQIAGKNNSWAIRWYASAFLAGMLTLYPGTSLVENIGFDGTGTHSKKSGAFVTPIGTFGMMNKIDIAENTDARRAVARYFKSLRPGMLERLRRRLHNVIMGAQNQHE